MIECNEDLTTTTTTLSKVVGESKYAQHSPEQQADDDDDVEDGGKFSQVKTATTHPSSISICTSCTCSNASTNTASS